MSLNVKDPEAHRLAQRIAKETGESITSTVIEALREKLARLEHKNVKTLAADLRAIRSRAAVHARKPVQEHGDFLYDEKGLPK